ncbi:LytTR family DNA-binding domain-containing protein [Actinomycetes bacterium NPDC127524]
MDPFTVSSVMNVISEFFPKDTSIAVANDQNFIYYQPSKKVDLKIRPGDRVSEDTVTYKALTVHKKTSEFIERNGFGVPYYGMSVPILDNGSTRGVVTAILPSKPSFMPSSFLTIKTIDRWIPVPYGEVMYLEAQNRKTSVVSKRISGSHKLNLSEIEWLLPNELFIRVHRSYIVNIHFIEEILPDFHSTFLLVMKDSTRIQVSQTYASQFRRALGF